jgi:hypothetical protein
MYVDVQFDAQCGQDHGTADDGHALIKRAGPDAEADIRRDSDSALSPQIRAYP